MKWLVFLVFTVMLTTACRPKGQGQGESETEGGPPSQPTIQNNSADMILHISSGGRSLSIEPGECAVLKPEDFADLHVEESNMKWGWYLLSLDILSYENVCVPAGESIFSALCPKEAGHYLYLENDKPLIPLDFTSREAKNCSPL